MLFYFNGTFCYYNKYQAEIIQF